MQQGPSYAQIKASDGSFSTNGCQNWVQADGPFDHTVGGLPLGSFPCGLVPDGDYRSAGVTTLPGVYITNTPNCTWYRLRSFSDHPVRAPVDNDVIETQPADPRPVRGDRSDPTSGSGAVGAEPGHRLRRFPRTSSRSRATASGNNRVGTFVTLNAALINTTGATIPGPGVGFYVISPNYFAGQEIAWVSTQTPLGPGGAIVLQTNALSGRVSPWILRSPHVHDPGSPRLQRGGLHDRHVHVHRGDQPVERESATRPAKTGWRSQFPQRRVERCHVAHRRDDDGMTDDEVLDSPEPTASTSSSG